MDVMYEKQPNPLFAFSDSLLTGIPHLHKELELVYVESGNALAFADRRYYTLHEGDLFFAFPYQIHYYEQCRSGCYHVFIVSTDILFEAGSLFHSQSPESNVLHVDSGSPLAAHLGAFQAAAEAHNRIRQCGYLQLVVSEMIPRMTLRPSIQARNPSLHSVLDYCAEHYAEEISLLDVAEALHLSKYYVSHLLNNHLKLSFNDYINTLRLNAACEQLKETSKKIADISENVGFGSIRSFNRAFLQLTNLTPGEYRKALRPTLTASSDSEC